MKKFVIAFALIAVCLAFRADMGFCAPDGKKMAKEVARRAKMLREDNQIDRALEVLQLGLQRCGRTDDVSACRAILHFNLGYLHQEYAGRVDAGGSGLSLDEAAGHYRRVLSLYPENKQAARNLALALKRQGKSEGSEKLLLEAAAEDPEKLYSSLILLGDAKGRKKDYEAAVAYYDRAIAIDKQNDDAYEKKLLAYRRMSSDRQELVENIFALAAELEENRKPRLARQAYEQIVKRTCRKEEDAAVAALVCWTRLAAESGWISNESLNQFPDSSKWPHPANVELRKLVDAPEKALDILDWWAQRVRMRVPGTDREYQRHFVATAVLNARAGALLVRGETERASAVYDAALVFMDEYFDSYYNAPPVFFALCQNMATFLFNHPRFDPEDKKFKKLTSLLFGGKVGAYAENKRESIHRFHTVLGLIYAEKGVWESEWEPANAMFQLENALRTADPDKRYPQLEGLLAEGYQKRGWARGAADYYVRAAKGYLELDDLKKTGQVLDSFEKIAVRARVSAAKFNKEAAHLRTILRARESVPRLPASFFDRSQEQWKADSDFSWLFGQADLGLDEGFMALQRYKLLADLGKRAESFQKRDQARFLQIRALDAAKKRESLGSNGDALRMVNIQKSLSERVALSPDTVGIVREDAVKSEESRYWKIDTPYQQTRTAVRVSNDVILAGEVLEAMDKVSPPAETVPANESPPLLRIEKGEVSIQSAPGADREKARRAIGTVQGVKRIKPLESSPVYQGPVRPEPGTP